MCMLCHDNASWIVTLPIYFFHYQTDKKRFLSCDHQCITMLLRTNILLHVLLLSMTTTVVFGTQVASNPSPPSQNTGNVDLRKVK